MSEFAPSVVCDVQVDLTDLHSDTTVAGDSICFRGGIRPEPGPKEAPSPSETYLFFLPEWRCRGRAKRGCLLVERARCAEDQDGWFDLDLLPLRQVMIDGDVEQKIMIAGGSLIFEASSGPHRSAVSFVYRASYAQNSKDELASDGRDQV